MIKIAPIAKLDAMKTDVPLVAANFSISTTFSFVNPVLPITRSTPKELAVRLASMAASEFVKSTITSGS